jgi:hypothetical protein
VNKPEEPPVHSAFIFITSDPDKLPHSAVSGVKKHFFQRSRILKWLAACFKSPDGQEWGKAKHFHDRLEQFRLEDCKKS